MIFKYDGKATLRDDERFIHVEQNINPFIMKSINNYDDAERWMRQYLSNELNAQPMFFSMQIIDPESRENALKVVSNKNFIFKVKESTQRLSGKYLTRFSSPCDHEDVGIELFFADGESEFECSFNHAGKYELVMANDFFVGENKYIAISTETEAVNLSTENEIHSLVFEVE